MTSIHEKSAMLAESGSAMIDSHPFIPRGKWFTPCKVCGLAEAAHLDSVLIQDRDDDDANRDS